jgi:hypothetical protein
MNFVETSEVLKNILFLIKMKYFFCHLKQELTFLDKTNFYKIFKLSQTLIRFQCNIIQPFLQIVIQILRLILVSLAPSSPIFDM